MLHQAPKALIPDVLGHLGLEGKRKIVDRSLASIKKSLQAENWHTRLAALEALDQQNGDVPIEPLLFTLHDADASVRAVAVRLLGQRDESVAMTGLEEALRDPDWHVRETAVFALGQHVSPPIDLLVFAQNDEDSAVRKAATSILQDIQTESYTVRSLSPDKVQQTQSNPHFSKVYDYTNRLLRHIQGLEDRIVPRQHSQTNRNFIMSEEGDGKVKQRPVIRVLEVLVATLVVFGLVGSWFALTHGVRTSTQGHTGTTPSYKGTLLYHQDEMTPAVYWTSNSKYIYIHDKQDTVLHFINVATKQVTTIANPDMVAQTTPGKLATLTPDGLSVCTVDNTGSMLHVQVQSVLTNKILFDTSYPKIANINTRSNFQWSNDGTHIAISSNNGTITLLNVRIKQQPVVLKGANADVNVVTWSQDDQQILATTGDGLVLLWNATTGQRTLDIKVSVYATNQFWLQLSPDSKHIVLVPNDQTIQILDATTGAKVFTYHDVMEAQNVDFIWLDNTHIISVSENISPQEQHVQIWNATTGRVTLDVPIAANSRWTTSYNNKYVVTQAPDGITSQVWNATTGRKVTAHASSSTYLPGSSPNEKYFITTAGGNDNKIDMWSTTTGKTVTMYHSSDPSVISAMWSPDGKYLLSLSTNGRMNPVGSTLDLWPISGM